ncbi:MAG: P1 family peptidase [Paracoccaceae bacterium]|nr:P1 family peptidase [Paracoccaceae bacterium]
MTTGPLNLITDVPGLLVGNAEDARLKSGVTVVTSEAPFSTAVHVMGGAPGTRETDLLAPENLVEQVDALVLSGGSAFGLDAATGVMNALRQAGRGFQVADQNIPIVPAAIMIDMMNGGDKAWTESPYPALGAAAWENASAEFEIGTAGAGTGPLTATLKGGLGSASVRLSGGGTVGAIVVVNPIGHVTVADGPHFWAAPFEIGDEFGGLGPAGQVLPPDLPVTKVTDRGATAIGAVATDIDLTKAQLKRMAIAAHDGIARSIYPSHTPFDGDLLFACSIGTRSATGTPAEAIELGHAAANCVARAVARGVFAATPAAGDVMPTWREKFGGGV